VGAWLIARRLRRPRHRSPSDRRRAPPAAASSSVSPRAPRIQAAQIPGPPGAGSMAPHRRCQGQSGACRPAAALCARARGPGELTGRLIQQHAGAAGCPGRQLRHSSSSEPSVRYGGCPCGGEFPRARASSAAADAWPPRCRPRSAERSSSAAISSSGPIAGGGRGARRAGPNLAEDHSQQRARRGPGHRSAAGAPW